MKFSIEMIINAVFSWSVGVRGVLWECGCTTIGAEFQWFQFSPKSDIVATNKGIKDETFVKCKYQEWQAGLGLSHRIHMFVPYIAVKWAGFKIDAFVTNQTNVQSSKLWGFAVGVSLIDGERAAITGEGRWGDENAAYINGQIRF